MERLSFFGRIRLAGIVAVRGLYDAIASSVSVVIGSYAAIDPRRKIIPRGLAGMRSLTANELATMSLPQLRLLCRKLERDNATARATVEGLVAQVVGTGIALEPDHGDDVVNARLRVAWQDYLRACDITGQRSIYDLQAQAFREIVVAGEFLWRMPVLPERAERGEIPLVVLPLECEWIAPEAAMASVREGITAVSGLELDKWGRPVAFHLQNPESAQPNLVERVAASEIIHGFERRRSLQARGEPWLAPVIERIWQEGDLVDAELKSAVTCAAMAIIITSSQHDAPDTTSQGSTDDPAQRVAVGAVARLYPGEDVKAFSHTRPAQQIAEFRRSLRGDIASACRTSQRWLDRDYSRANYSSMRADMLDSERLLSPVREWFGNATIGALYLRALPYLCVVAGVRMPKRLAFRLVPEGQPYVDPLKDVQAAILAVTSGMSTWEREIGRRGEDAQQLHDQLAKELRDPLLARIFAANLKEAAPGSADGAAAGDAASEPDGDEAKPSLKPTAKGTADG